MTPAALYLRCSTDRQDTSLAQQARELERYAQAHGLVPVVAYFDQGVSGTRTDRPGFSACLAAAESGEANWEAVLVYDRSRWGRFEDALESAYHESRLRHCGKRLLSLTPYDDTLVGHIMRLIDDDKARTERKDILTRLQRGRCHAISLGYWTQGRPPYGYRTEKVKDGRRMRSRLVIGPQSEVETVRRIFTLRKENESLQGIVDALQDVPSPKGKGWTRQVVRQILLNPVYTGNCVIKTSKWGGGEVSHPCPAIVGGEAI